MSLGQLDAIIDRFEAIKGAWGSDVTLARMRADLEGLHSSFAAAPGTQTRVASAGGVPAEWVQADRSAGGRAVLYLHGGGFAVGSIRATRNFASRLSEAAQARVLVIGYRLAPEHTFPAQIDDALAAYRWLIDDQGIGPEQIAIAGDSAGAGLSLALLGEIASSNGRMPACGILLTPWVDMRCAGRSYETNRNRDPVASREMALMMAATYLGPTGRAEDPRATPVLASFAGYPPLLIQSAGRDVFLDDARAVAECACRAGVPVTVDEWPQMIHNWQLYAAELDEGAEALHRAGAFVRDRITRQ